MIAKAIDGSITKTSLKTLSLHQGEYEWSEYGGIIINDGPTMFCFLFKTISPAKRIGASNLNY